MQSLYLNLHNGLRFKVDYKFKTISGKVATDQHKPV